MPFIDWQIFRPPVLAWKNQSASERFSLLISVISI
jgi:hypothetical protein